LEKKKLFFDLCILGGFVVKVRVPAYSDLFRPIEDPSSRLFWLLVIGASLELGRWNLDVPPHGSQISPRAKQKTSEAGQKM
jgi:hypothetical protein